MLEWPLIERVLAGETDRYEIEKRYIRKDGEIIRVRLVGTVIRDRDGAPQAGLAIIEDVTERKEAEDRLRYHANLVDTVSDAIISTDTDLIIRSWNRAAERIYGWRADEVVGLKGSDILKTEFPEGTSREALTSDLFDTGFWQGELVQHTKDGRPIFVEATSIRLTDGAGTVIGGVSVSRDITERKEAEEALRLSERNLAASQEIAAIGSYTWDLETNRMFWSDELYRILGMAPGEVPPTFDTYTAFIFPDDREETIRKSRRMNETGEPRPNEHRIVRADGTVRTVQVASRVFSEEHGRPRMLHGIVQDVTERKAAEEVLREYAANLQRSNEDLERYAYVSSHDLQEPLRAIVSFSQLLERRYRGQLGAGRGRVHRLHRRGREPDAEP